MTNSNNTPDLLQLVQKYRRDRTYAQIAKDSGDAFTGNTISTWATKDQTKFPKVRVILGLAKALGVTPFTVIEAAATTLGIDFITPGADKHDLVLPGARTLPLDSHRLLEYAPTWGQEPAQPDYSLAANTPGEPSQGSILAEAMDEAGEHGQDHGDDHTP